MDGKIKYRTSKKSDEALIARSENASGSRMGIYEPARRNVVIDYDTIAI
jgi:hypothetical protein